MRVKGKFWLIIKFQSFNSKEMKEIKKHLANTTVILSYRRASPVGTSIRGQQRWRWLCQQVLAAQSQGH